MISKRDSGQESQMQQQLNLDSQSNMHGRKGEGKGQEKMPQPTKTRHDRLAVRDRVGSHAAFHVREQS